MFCCWRFASRCTQSQPKPKESAGSLVSDKDRGWPEQHVSNDFLKHPAGRSINGAYGPPLTDLWKIWCVIIGSHGWYVQSTYKAHNFFILLVSKCFLNICIYIYMYLLFPRKSYLVILRLESFGIGALDSQFFHVLPGGWIPMVDSYPLVNQHNYGNNHHL